MAEVTRLDLGNTDNLERDDLLYVDVPQGGAPLNIWSGERFKIKTDVIVQVINGEDVFRLRELSDGAGLAFWVAPMTDPARIEHGVWYAITRGDDGEPRIDALPEEP